MTKSLDPSEIADIERMIANKKRVGETLDVEAQLEEILSEALSVVRQQLGVGVGFIAEFSDGRRVIKAINASEMEQALEVGDSDPLEETYCQRIVDGRFPKFINDASEFADAQDLSITSELQIRAYAGVPICFSDGEVYGTLCCFSTREGKDFYDKDLVLLAAFARLTGQQIEKARYKYGANRRLAKQVRSIIDHGLMRPVFQPICDIGEKRIIGYEALTRFDIEPYQPPNVWFAAGEAVGLQTELEISAINAALSHLDQIPADRYISVNASPETLRHPSFFDHLTRYPLDRLLVEVTEHTHVHDYPLFNKQIQQLRSHGVKLAIDDVGAGYSSLRHILELQPEFIKLDRSLICEIDKRFDLRSMATALIGFATDMNIKIVAEGIETEEELNWLGELGVSRAQGYLLGKPASVEELQRDWPAINSAYHKVGS